MKRFISKNSPPKLGGVAQQRERDSAKHQEKRAGVVPEVRADRHASLEPPRLLARLAGTPPNLGGELR